MTDDVMDGSLNWTCGYTPSGVLECLNEAVWHGMKLTEDGSHIAAMMASCDEHRPRMERAADYVHSLVHPCGVPGSRFRWPENHCYMDWDEEEFAGAVMVHVPMRVG